jgi:hypothetical protein
MNTRFPIIPLPTRWGRHSCLPLFFLLVLFLPNVLADAPAPLYTQDFEKLEPGDPPADLMTLDGTFAVRKVDGNTLLELEPDPLDSHGMLFGPAELNTYTVSARIQGMATGKRTPEFGIGACGPNRYKLWLMPATNQLQLIRGDEVKTSQPYKWTSGAWTRFKLQVTKQSDGKFKIQGKAWSDGKEEPKDWMLTMEDTDAPRPGRAGIFATPYSDQVTRFDDLRVEPTQ